MLGLTFEYDKNWTLTSKADHADRGFRDKVFGIARGVSAHYKKLEVPAPGIKLEMKALDYFLTTNILFPGNQVFHAHQLTEANKKLGLGLAFPRDLILTGDIKSNK